MGWHDEDEYYNDDLYIPDDYESSLGYVDNTYYDQDDEYQQSYEEWYYEEDDDDPYWNGPDFY